MNKLKLSKLPNLTITAHKSQGRTWDESKADNLNYPPKQKPTPAIPEQEFNSLLSAHRFKEQTGCKRKIKKLAQNKFVV